LSKNLFPVLKKRTIIHVDLNAFYPSCEVIRDNSLKGLPLIIIMSPEPIGELTRGVIASCSYEARSYGLRAAMSYVQAKKLCPDGIFKRADFDLYTSISSDVMQLLQKFTSKIEQASIDEAYLDVTDKISDSYTAADLSSDIKNDLKLKLNLICSIGTAPTKVSAKIASDYQKPDGLTIISFKDVKSFLFPLKVGIVPGIGPKTEKSLNLLKITTLGDLSNYSREKLMAKFGKIGIWMWKVANGIDDDEVISDYEAKSRSAEHTLLDETSDKTIILNELLLQAREVYDKLINENLEYRTVGIKILYNNFNSVTRSYSYKLPRSDWIGVNTPIERLIDRIDLESTKVRKVGIKLSDLSNSNSNSEIKQSSISDWA